jgi:Ni,Fe-hydrogenase I large subunit
VSLSARLLKQFLQKDWCGLGRHDLPFLPELPEESLLLRCREDGDFSLRPTWDGLPHETSSLTRMAHFPALSHCLLPYGCGLASRVMARLLELALWLDRLNDWDEQDARIEPLRQNHWLPELKSGQGVGVVETVRGRLIHQVELGAGKITRYNIIAPTEWNFHPRGPISQALLNLSDEDPTVLRRQADLLIQLMDPCVGYELIIESI